LLSLFLGSALGAVAGDEVTSLPGWTGPLRSKQYSGYIQIPGNKFIHYWLIQSERNPATDPLAMWLNGGPGSSSLIGLLTENGQIATNDASLTNMTNGVPNVFYNPYGWTTVANVLWVEQPAGVGFSYCTDSTGKNIMCSNTDDSMAVDMYAFLQNWFQAYSEFSNHTFYITGESYAGIYIPLIAQQIMNNQNNINLKALAIGNGCWGNTVGTCAFGSGDAMRISANFYYGHAMYSQTLYSQLMAACGNFSNPSAACETQIGIMDAEIGNFDVYNIYDECGNDDLSLLDYFKQDAPGSPYYMKAFAPEPPTNLGGAVNDYQCGGETAMDEWLAVPSVQQALHVKPGGQQNYKKTATNLLPLYQQLIQKYRVLIYSGDSDACVPYYGTEEWTYGLGFNVTKTWHPWTTNFVSGDSGVGGYVTNFASNFTFLTIKGSGHMVPTFQPASALTMITRFFANQAY